MSLAAKTTKYSLWSYYRAALIILAITILVLTGFSGNRLRGVLFDQLRDELEHQARIIATSIETGWIPVGPEICGSLSIGPDYRITVIAHSGDVICDSAADHRTMDNHRDRPEVATALRGTMSSITRYSKTLSAELLYVAVPVVEGGPITHAVRAARPLTSIEQTVFNLYGAVALFGLVLVVTVATVSTFLYRKVNPPLSDIARGANRFAQGHFGVKLPDYDVRELAELAATLNRMAGQLERMERIRSDFVANVSHELRTPVTSIKGFVETLRDGAKDDPADLERFLDIIAMQSERLAAIIEDLLILSRLEGEPAAQLLDLTDEPVRSMLESVREVSRPRADEKDIAIEIECSDLPHVIVDRSLLVQALINLVDNAIKYSPQGTTITLSAVCANEVMRLNVADQGPGIDPVHQERLFERFYRVDKARSRNLGGTGLGLAIVKHVANIHGADVSVTSEIERGATFSIDLPAPASDA